MVRKVPWWKGWTIHILEKWETANPNGQPRKLFSTVNKELKAKWITQLTKSQLIEAYWLIFNTDEQELKNIGSDKSVPYALRLIIAELNDKRNRSKAMADYRDYMFGKAVQKTEERRVDKDWNDVLILDDMEKWFKK